MRARWLAGMSHSGSTSSVRRYQRRVEKRLRSPSVPTGVNSISASVRSIILFPQGAVRCISRSASSAARRRIVMGLSDYVGVPFVIGRRSTNVPSSLGTILPV